MELEKLRELIEKTKSFKNPACLELADHFEVFVELLQQQRSGILDPTFTERFNTCMKQFWGSFDRAAESLGFSPDELKSNMNNPEYFAPGQWNEIQALKRQISGDKEPKLKKAKKRVRI